MFAYVSTDERSTTPTWVRTTVVADKEENPQGKRVGDVLHVLYSEHTWAGPFDGGSLPVNRMVARADGVVLFIERLTLRSENDTRRFAEVLGHAWRDATILRSKSDPGCTCEGTTNMSVFIDNGGVTLVIGYLRLMVPEAVRSLISALENAQHATGGGVTTLGGRLLSAT